MTQPNEAKYCLIYSSNKAPYCNDCFNCRESEQPDEASELDVMINGQKYILPFDYDFAYASGYKQGQKDMHEIEAAAQARTKQATIELVRSGMPKKQRLPDNYMQPRELNKSSQILAENAFIDAVNRLLTDIEKGE